jgi:hypothetical protein
MSVRSFRSVFMVGGVAAAALSCYLVSLRVASERAALESVETEIVLAQRDIRLLQTEIGTRGRLAQLERWNVKVLALSAPSADQFVPDGFQLARLATPERKLDVEAPIHYASAPATTAPNVLSQPITEAPSAPPAKLMQQASLKLPASRPSADRPTAKSVSAEKPASKPSAKPVVVAAKKAATPPAKPKATGIKLAQADPLAPIPAVKKKPAAASKPVPATSRASSSANKASSSANKDSDKAR